MKNLMAAFAFLVLGACYHNVSPAANLPETRVQSGGPPSQMDAGRAPASRFVIVRFTRAASGTDVHLTELSRFREVNA